MAKKRAVRPGVLAAIHRAIRSVVAIKNLVTGKKWQQAHRIESELATLAGTKVAMKRRQKMTAAMMKAMKAKGRVGGSGR